MLPRIPKPSSPVWSSEPLLGFKLANLHSGGSHVGCLPASVGTAELAATSPEINGKIAFSSWIDAGEVVENPTGDAEIFAIEPDGAGPIRRTHIGESSERIEPRLAKGKP
jgi:hypothetical protein